MTTIPHESSHVTRKDERWTARFLVPEMWASLAIVVMWLAVLFDAIYGPDIVATSGTPGATATSTTVPSAVVVALFAFLGTWVVARHGFDRRGTE
jgi:hypothetical protein